ncbi:MAG: hypothetical protein ACRD2L_10595 [Terriglobia bacterium]
MKPEKVFAWTIAGALLLCLLIVQTLRWFSLDPLPQSNAKDERREAQPQQPAPSLPAKESVFNLQSHLAALPFDEASETLETPEMPTQTDDSDVDPSGVVGGVMPNEEPVVDLKAAGVIPDDQIPLLDYEAETALQLEAAEQEAAMRAAMNDGNIDPSGATDGDIPQNFSAPDSGATGVGAQ